MISNNDIFDEEDLLAIANDECSSSSHNSSGKSQNSDKSSDTDSVASLSSLIEKAVAASTLGPEPGAVPGNKKGGEGALKNLEDDTRSLENDPTNDQLGGEEEILDGGSSDSDGDGLLESWLATEKECSTRKTQDDSEDTAIESEGGNPKETQNSSVRSVGSNDESYGFFDSISKEKKKPEHWDIESTNHEVKEGEYSYGSKNDGRNDNINIKEIHDNQSVESSGGNRKDKEDSKTPRVSQNQSPLPSPVLNFSSLEVSNESKKQLECIENVDRNADDSHDAQTDKMNESKENISIPTSKHCELSSVQKQNHSIDGQCNVFEIKPSSSVIHWISKYQSAKENTMIDDRTKQKNPSIVNSTIGLGNGIIAIQHDHSYPKSLHDKIGQTAPLQLTVGHKKNIPTGSRLSECHEGIIEQVSITSDSYRPPPLMQSGQVTFVPEAERSNPGTMVDCLARFDPQEGCYVLDIVNLVVSNMKTVSRSGKRPATRGNKVNKNSNMSIRRQNTCEGDEALKNYAEEEKLKGRKRVNSELSPPDVKTSILDPRSRARRAEDQVRKLKQGQRKPKTKGPNTNQDKKFKPSSLAEKRKRSSKKDDSEKAHTDAPKKRKRTGDNQNN